MKKKVKILTSLVLLACLLTACKFLETVESLPQLQPTATATLFLLPTSTPGPTETSTPMPTATLYRGVQNPKNGHWYLLVNQERSWRTAQEYCTGMGAHLVTLKDEAENLFVYNLASFAWLGATNENSSGRWEWISGEPMTYTNWAEGEPNNCGQPDCQPEYFMAYADGSAQWNDVPALKLPFICEWDE